MVAEADETAAYFVRVKLMDKAGSLAELTEALADAGVSIDKLLQDSADEDGAAPIAIVTHLCSRKEISNARERLQSLASNVGTPQIMAIEASSE